MDDTSVSPPESSPPQAAGGCPFAKMRPEELANLFGAGGIVSDAATVLSPFFMSGLLSTTNTFFGLRKPKAPSTALERVYDALHTFLMRDIARELWSTVDLKDPSMREVQQAVAAWDRMAQQYRRDLAAFAKPHGGLGYAFYNYWDVNGKADFLEKFPGYSKESQEKVVKDVETALSRLKVMPFRVEGRSLLVPIPQDDPLSQRLFYLGQAGIAIQNHSVFPEKLSNEINSNANILREAGVHLGNTIARVPKAAVQAAMQKSLTALAKRMASHPPGDWEEAKTKGAGMTASLEGAGISVADFSSAFDRLRMRVAAAPHMGWAERQEVRATPSTDGQSPPAR